MHQPRKPRLKAHSTKRFFLNDQMIQNAYFCHDTKYREDVSPDQNLLSRCQSATDSVEEKSGAIFKCIQTTVMYLTACTLFLTTRTIQQLAVDEQNSLELFQT